MTELGQDRIAFDVETSRVLEILSKEIYDSPYALLRENLQNAYDAILMRYAGSTEAREKGKIDIRIDATTLVIADNGLGMTETVLRNNFWRAGSSGKRTELAKRSGVIGTFGIGAMANFGVCTRLRVETRSAESDFTLISTAVRDNLSISKECIDLERIKDERLPGTRIVVDLDPRTPLSEGNARSYLDPYVRYLPVAVYLNGQPASQDSYEAQLQTRLTQALARPQRQIAQGIYQCVFQVWIEPSGNVLARLSQLTLEGNSVQGDLWLVQGGGQLMGLRNYFGLAPVPLNTYYQLGGIANLSILQPTAGREALSRESIDHVNRLVAMCEAAITEEIAQSDAADRNQSFQQYILTHGRYDLAERVSVRLLPDDGPVALADIAETCKGRKVYYYGGWDNSIIQRFASDQSYLLHLAGGSPKRNVQFYFIRDRLRIEEVPDHPTILKVYTGADLTIDEASILIRVLTVLNDDYLMYNIEAAFAEISHGVPFEVRHADGKIHFYLARNSGPVRPLLECYKTAHDVFMSFVKDFVRSQLYPRFSQFVPSASKEGADALYKLLQKNRELYRYEESDLGDLEALLADYISGAKPWADVLKNARSAAAVQTETVVSGQVGQLEQELSDVVHSTEADGSQVEGNELVPAPPIMRTDTVCDSKVLVTKEKYQQLNNIEVFLGLSDRLFKREGQFFHYPHTTRVIWAAHRVIYIFTDASSRLTLYYDIELKEPLSEQPVADAAMLPTTTIITNNRIFVPVPLPLVSAFKITEGAREFFVRFDVLTN